MRPGGTATLGSLDLKDASLKTAMLSRQLEDDSHVLHAYTTRTR